MPDKPSTLADSATLCDALVDALGDGKGQDITRLEVSQLTTMADFMIIASGTSSRHVKALASNTVDAMRDQGIRPRGVEGEEDGDWVLLDFGDVIVHVMQRAVRDHYDLEGLWQSGFGDAMLRRARDVAD